MDFTLERGWPQGSCTRRGELPEPPDWASPALALCQGPTPSAPAALGASVPAVWPWATARSVWDSLICTQAVRIPAGGGRHTGVKTEGNTEPGTPDAGVRGCGRA